MSKAMIELAIRYGVRTAGEFALFVKGYKGRV